MAKRNKTKYYTIIGPKVLRPNSQFAVAVTAHRLTESLNMQISLNCTKETKVAFSLVKKLVLEPNAMKKIYFDIGNIEPCQYQISAVVDAGLTFEKRTDLKYNPKNFSMFIQTDKAIYKPSDKIRFRVLILDAETKPFKPNGPINIFLYDGKGNRVKQWLKVKTIKGVFSSEMQLSNAPVLGNWRFQVDCLSITKDKNVEVAEYVLPKYEVIINSPEFVPFKDGKVVIPVRSVYTYGKCVVGELVIKAYATYYWQFSQPLSQNAIATKTVPINCETTVEFDIKADLKIENEYEREVQVEAIVVEALTGRTQSSMKKVVLTERRSRVEVISYATEFKPDLSFRGHIRVTKNDGTPVQDTINPVTLTTRFSFEQGKEINSSHILNKNGIADFSLSIPKDAVAFSVYATYMGDTGYMNYVPKAISDTNNYIEATCLTKDPKINSEIQIQVESTEIVKEFHYHISARGNMLLEGSEQVPASKLHYFTFDSSFAMAPKAQLVVYTIKPNGEIVSDRISISFGGTLGNTIKLDLSKDEVLPGEIVDLTIETTPNSYVGLLGIDQSVLLLKKGNDLEKDEIFNELNLYDGSDIWYPSRGKRCVHFDDAGMFILSNAKCPKSENSWYNGPIGSGRPGGIAFSTRRPSPQFLESVGGSGPGLSNAITIRKDFSETIFWKDIETKSNCGCRWRVARDVFTGESTEISTTISEKVPDTITSWIITGFAVSPENGLGLTDRPEILKVFKPFFIALDLPYSIKRGEIVAISIIVFNYLKTDQSAEVILYNTGDEFEFVGGRAPDNRRPVPSRKKQVMIKSNDGKNVRFLIKPRKPGYIKIKVTAQSKIAGDGIEKQLLVVPEGLPRYINEGVLVDLRDSNSFSKSITCAIPNNAVPDSSTIGISIVGDILGNTVKNLDQLIQMPYGCGEQNLVNFVPDIVIINYLTAIRKLTPDIEKKAKGYLESGYQRQLNYKRYDGSFSAFGERDTNGSIWLTAFTAKSFQLAKKYIYIDPEVIKAALTFLAKYQATNGSFPEIGHVSNAGLQGGSGKGMGLTAYVLITLLECQKDYPEFKINIDRGVDYLVKNKDIDDVYNLALTAYTLQLANHNAKDSVLVKFDSKASGDNDRRWWSKPIPESDRTNPWYNRPNSVNVEMTAYGLQTYVIAGRDSTAFSVVKWLLGQQNELGGFQSTQDTVVALQALAAFGIKLAANNRDIDLTITHGNKNTKVKIDETNALVLQTYDLLSTIRKVDISAKGRGVAVAQLSCKYYIDVKGESPRFEIDLKIKEDDKKNFVNITVCTSFIRLGDIDQSNMAVIEIEYPSGYTSDADNIDFLKRNESIQRVETMKGDKGVILYLYTISTKEICITATAFKLYGVCKQRPSSVNIYDYYDTTRRANAFYGISDAGVCQICQEDECQL